MPAASTATHRYFLTGGVDYLLDERSDTEVFHAVVKKYWEQYRSQHAIPLLATYRLGRFDALFDQRRDALRERLRQALG